MDDDGDPQYTKLWTLDRKLKSAATELEVDYKKSR
jgi:hypothetical protein